MWDTVFVIDGITTKGNTLKVVKSKILRKIYLYILKICLKYLKYIYV